MRNKASILAFALALALAGAALAPAGCAAPADPGPRPAATAGEALGVPTRESILGGWRLETIGGARAPAGAAFTLNFGADGQASGTINCNRVSAPYSVEGGRIAFGEGSRTLVGCGGSPDLSPAERSVFAARRTWHSADGWWLVFEGERSVAFLRTGH